jgi:hypothetical protein
VGPDRPPQWCLVRFIEHLDRWAELERPDEHTRLVVADWVLSRHDNPYMGVRREPGFANLWFGRVPGTLDGAGSVVVCSYLIYEETMVIRCNGIGRLSLPI